MTKTKKPKPIDYDIHIKYSCPKCGQYHWLSFKESSTKNFKIVCDCDHIFTVKRTAGFEIKYASKPKQPEVKPPVDNNTIDDALLTKAVNLLCGYGFTTKEAKEIIVKSYEQNPVSDFKLLVQQSLASLRNENVN